MNREQGKIGFDRQIRLAWLDATADLVAQGLSVQEIRLQLDRLLDGEVAGTDSRSAKGKTKTVLLHIWALVPEYLKPLREEGLSLIRQRPNDSRIVVHWGMCIASYPFFRIVAEAVGRLAKLQGEVAGAQVQRRVKEVFGARETVSRAVRRVLRSFVEWDVLQETGEKGVYRAGAVLHVKDHNLTAWLVEAALISQGSNASALTAITQSPFLFPFILDSLNTKQLENSVRLELLRQGLNQDVVKLRAAAAISH
jgi:hypothetical protein